MSFLSKLKSVFVRSKLSAVTMQPVTTPTTRAVEKLKTFFAEEKPRYELYHDMVDLDSELDSAIRSAAMICDRCLKGFTVETGKQLEPIEQELADELKLLDKKIRGYFFDIAFKLLRDGDVCYVIDLVKNEGIRELVWLPIDQLSILESKADQYRYELKVQEANFYCLNEVPTETNPTQWFPANDVAHFNWGKQEKIKDRFGRWTLGIYNYPPIESLVPKCIWKFAILINDMLLREVNVPREHHKLPSAPYDPNLFGGDSYEKRLKAAQDAAQNAMIAYAQKLEGRRVDRGYITLDNVTIDVIEPKLQYTDPNPLLTQIDRSVFSSVGVTESAVTGATRATYAAEIALESYLLLKTEFLAQRIASKLVELAKRHLTVKTGEKFTEHFDKISYDVQLVFMPREVARTIALLRETGIFTKTELRAMIGKEPLTAEQEKDLATPIGRKHTESGAEVTSTETRREQIDVPITPESREQRQVT